MHFETVIGLEVHVELKTDSKMFSPSPAHFGAEPNSNTNVIDLAYPGVLPVVNKRAVDWAMRAAMALRHIKFLNLINQLVKMDISISKSTVKQNESVLLVFTWKKMLVSQHIKVSIH